MNNPACAKCGRDDLMINKEHGVCIYCMAFVPVRERMRQRFLNMSEDEFKILLERMEDSKMVVCGEIEDV